MTGKAIGAVAGSAHAAFLADFYRGSKVTTFPNVADLRDALKAGKIDAIFSDGPSLAVWLAGTDSGGCCRFAGGPYLEPRNFGHGEGFAVRSADAAFAQALDAALWDLEGSGRLAEIERRYFPVSFE